MDTNALEDDRWCIQEAYPRQLQRLASLEDREDALTAVDIFVTALARDAADQLRELLALDWQSGRTDGGLGPSKDDDAIATDFGRVEGRTS